MSPDEIPGTVIKFLTRSSSKKCGRCKDAFDHVSLKRDKDSIYKCCPNCDNILEEIPIKEVERLIKKRGK